MSAAAPPAGSGAPPAAAPVSRRLIVIGFIASTLLTTALGGVSSWVLAERQTTRAEEISQVNRFLKSTEDFEPLMRRHVQNIVHGRSLDHSREALLQNMQNQHVLLRGVRAYVPTDLRSQADTYEETLVMTADALDDADKPLTAGPLLQQVSNAVSEKQKLAAALRKGVGLPE